MWVPVRSNDKISDSWIRDLEFNLRLNWKTDWCLGQIIKSGCYKLDLSKKKIVLISILNVCVKYHLLIINYWVKYCTAHAWLHVIWRLGKFFKNLTFSYVVWVWSIEALALGVYIMDLVSISIHNRSNSSFLDVEVSLSLCMWWVRPEVCPNIFDCKEIFILY